MGYMKFFKLIFQYLAADLTIFCDSPLSRNSVTANRTTFRIQPNKRSLCTISRRNRQYNNCRPTTWLQRNINSIVKKTADELDKKMAVEPQNYEPMEPVAHRTRSQNNSNQNYKQYLTQVLRKINGTTDQPMMILSSNAMECMNNFMVNVFNRIALEAKMKTKTKKRDWDIKSSFKIVMPNELGVHAITLVYGNGTMPNAERGIIIAKSGVF